MPPQQFNDQDSPSQAPPPRFGPMPDQPIINDVSQSQSKSDQPKKRKTWLIILAVALIVALLGVLAYFFISKIMKPAEPSATAVQEYSPSVISMIKGSESWKNGRFEVMGGHGLPTVKGSFIKTTSGQFYTVADVNAQEVESSVAQLDEIAPNHAPIYTGNEYQVNTLGLINQIGYGMDKNVLDFLEDLLTELGEPTKSPEFVGCQADLNNYYGKAGNYLNTLKPNYVYNEKYQSYQWSLDTTELFKNLAVKTQSPACYEFLDKILTSNVDNANLAGTQLIFEVTEESADGATFKMFAAPASPSEEYEFIFKITISDVNKAETPKSYLSDPDTIFGRGSAFALTISECDGLPVIATVSNSSPVFITPDNANYKGPQIRDLGYYCTAAEAAKDGYFPVTN
ncbi:MAG TPA: hypothetical protein VLA77_03745 [Candidatus Saccharimonadales bacterium]|nr:hypothetical protein [Candidatus Saccharimonadales bacterium]